MANSRGGLRFYKAGQSGISDTLFDALSGLSREFGTPIGITSGYRSPAYNRKVGGAKRSLHVPGKAADIDMTGWSQAQRQAAVQELTQRGVTGFITYSNSPNMMHVDMRPRPAGTGPLFMHDKYSANLSRAPGWFREMASVSGLKTPYAGPTPFSPNQLDPNNLRTSSLGIEPPASVPNVGIEVAAVKNPLGIGNVPTRAASQPIGASFASGDVAPYADVGFPGFDGVQRAPLTTPVRPAPAMPSTAELSPLKPSIAIGPTAENIAPPSAAELAAAYGKMGADMQSVGVSRLGMMPAPNSPVAMPEVAPQQPTIAPAPAHFPPSMPEVQAPPISVPRSMPSSLQAPSVPRGDPFGSTASMDNFGNSLVTNRFGVTTATMPDGKQAAYGKGKAGPLGRTSLLGNVGMPGGASGLVGGLLGAAIGSALAGPVGGMIGGLAGKSLIGGNLGGGGFPSAPGTFGEKQGKGLSRSERASISPAADKSMSKNSGRMSGLW